MRKKKEKEKKKGGCLSKILIILVIFGVLGAIGGSSDEVATPTATPTAIPATASSVVKKPVEENQDALHNIIISVFGDDLNKYELKYNDLFIETHIDVVLTPSIEKKSYQLKVLELLKKINEIIESDEYEINIVYLSASCDFTDAYGNETSKEAFYSAFRKDTIQKINFDNVYFDSIPQIADDWYEHPEF